MRTPSNPGQPASAFGSPGLSAGFVGLDLDVDQRAEGDIAPSPALGEQPDDKHREQG